VVHGERVLTPPLLLVSPLPLLPLLQVLELLSLPALVRSPAELVFFQPARVLSSRFVLPQRALRLWPRHRLRPLAPSLLLARLASLPMLVDLTPCSSPRARSTSVPAPTPVPLALRRPTSLRLTSVKSPRRTGTITQESESSICVYTDNMNSMKWDALEATRGVFTFDTADETAAFAAENGKMLRCHTLLWHSQLPTWVEGITDKAELTEVIETHIAEVAGHFKGKCFAWVSFD
jgi:hypothetical protein